MYNSELEKKETNSQISTCKEVIERTVFSSDPGPSHCVEMDIELIDELPVRTKVYRMTPKQTEILIEEIRRLLELGLIEIGQSDFTSPINLVKAPGKNHRPYGD